MNSNREMTVALLSPCGHGNLGDAAIQDAVIGQIRLRIPTARIVGITLSPKDTLARHGIRAVTLRAIDSLGYGIPDADRFPEMFDSVFDDVSSSVPIQIPSETNSSGWGDNAQPPMGLLRRLTQPIRRPLYPIKQELIHIRYAMRMIEQVDMVLVSGGGQLDDYWGGSWGHPYVLCKWGWLATRVNKQFVIMGVGTGTLQNWLSKFFVKRALGKASFRSFRDGGSRDLAGAPQLTRDDTIGPDLAFGLDVSGYLDTSGKGGMSLHVALSPMSYLDPRFWPDKDKQAYDRYISLLAGLVNTITAQGHKVSLFASDGADERTITDLKKALQGSPACDKVLTPRVKTVKELLTLFADADVVVASRLHGVLLSCVMERPTLALSYDRKVNALMNDLGLSQYCREIERIEGPALKDLFAQLAKNRMEVRDQLKTRVRAAKENLDRQFDTVLGPRVAVETRKS
ncbi:MAG: polysaccharide pyruvyl transferase family protein [Candidatus Zixiibacteriota bacterium]